MRFIARFTIFVVFVGIYSVNAQQIMNQTLLTIGGEKIPASEFARIYLKNNQDVQTFDSKTIEEYLNLFINFKLKVTDALNAKLDTTTAFKRELAGYRQQLARPYMVDKETEQTLIAEAYERMKFEVNASHILIAVPEQVNHLDTLKYFEKAMAIRNRIIAGEPFDVVARATSDDPSVSSNNGILGYFTAFQMVYPFESAVYKLKVNEISIPIRTRFGYHIIKLNDKRPAKGQVKVAHIMIAAPKDANTEQQSQAKSKIQDIYKQVLNNEDFAKLAGQFSQDPGSSKNGGELPWIGTGNLVREFEQVAFGFEHDGQISEPFQSPFGWHIVKRLGRKIIGSYDDMLPEIKKKLSSDMRSIISIDKMVAKIKKENDFKEDTLNLINLVPLIDSSLYKAQWVFNGVKDNKIIFTLANQKFDQQAFCKYLEHYQKKGVKGSLYSIMKNAYNEWVKGLVYGYQESNLEQQFPEFKYLMQEYHDGILLFNISDANVWSKATSDSIGLLKFYTDRKDSYRWGERVHYVIYSSSDEKLLTKANKLIAGGNTKAVKPEAVLTKLNKNKQPQVNFTRKVVNADDPEVDGFKKWTNKVSLTTLKDGIYSFKAIEELTTNDIKDLADCKGQVVSDYQQMLEEEWVKTLRQKYIVDIDKEVLLQLMDSLNKKK